MPPKRKAPTVIDLAEDNDQPTVTTSPTKKQPQSSSTAPDITVTLTGVRSIDDKRTPSTESPKWETLFDGSLITRSFLNPIKSTSGLSSNTVPKIASFDMDATLIQVKSGNDFPKDENDWDWLTPNVPKKLRQLYIDGYEIIIFTNQNGIGIGKKRDDKLALQLQKKINKMSDIINVPITTYMACDKDRFRKPSRGMFDFMLDNIHEILLKMYSENEVSKLTELIHKDSFYCGDACGRGGVTRTELKKKGSGILKDHSGADYSFAVNCFGYKIPINQKDQLIFPGQRFYAPEELFDGKLSHQPFQSTKGSTTPYGLINNCDDKYSFEKTTVYQYLLQNKNKSQIILLVALPASGKTTFTENLQQMYKNNKEFQGSLPITWVNRDVLKTPEKCLLLAKNGLSQGQIVIIDNTNVDKASRKIYIDLALQFKVPIHCIYFETDTELSKHLNLVRTNYLLGERERLPGVAINMAKSKFQIPEINEGFTAFTIHKHVPPTSHNGSNPRPTPPAGISPLQTHSTTDYSRPSQTILGTVGHVTKSRTLEDCYYQIYDH